MSISSEITRLSGNVSDALTAIAAKGVAVPSGSNSDDLATLISQISGGGGGSGSGGIVYQDTDGYVHLSPESANVISIVDTTDTSGGTVRTITAIDISDTTAAASDVASGKYFYTADGTKTAGTADDGKWHRPSNYPNLDNIVVTNDCVVYLTYDLTKATTDEQKYISIYCQGVGYKQSTIERGHLNGNNEFVADATYTTSSYIFSQALDPQNGDIQLWRAINNTYGINLFRFYDYNSISGSSRYQPCIEMLASGTSTHPVNCLYITAIPFLMENFVLKNYHGNSAGYQGIYYAYGLKRVSFKDAYGSITDSRNFFQVCPSLTEVIPGSNFTLKNGGSGFYNCESLKTLVYPNYTALGASPTVIRNCPNLEEVDLRSLNVAGVTTINVNNFYNNGYRLKKLNMSGLDFSGLTSGSVSFSFPVLQDFYPPKFYISQTWNCPLLTVESLVRLLDVLPSTESALTLTIGAFNISKLTSAQIAVATAKGWTVA